MAVSGGLLVGVHTVDNRVVSVKGLCHKIRKHVEKFRASRKTALYTTVAPRKICIVEKLLEFQPVAIFHYAMQHSQRVGMTKVAGSMERSWIFKEDAL